MVRALLAGTKTQTRRVVKPQPDVVGRDVGDALPPVVGVFTPEDQRLGRLAKAIHCPYGQPGDRLWVREAWRAPASCDHLPPRSISDSEAVRFMADETVGAEPGFGKGRPGMFMPRWASRITLEVTAVRVERLQDISEDDSVAEGLTLSKGGMWCGAPHPAHGAPRQHYDARHAYRDLWEQINGPGSWDANPWVWAVSFRRIT